MTTSTELGPAKTHSRPGLLKISLTKRPELFWALISGALVYFVLAVYQPFGTRELAINFKLLRLAGYGVLTTILIYMGLARSRRVRLLDRGQQIMQELLIWAVCFVLAGCLSYLYYCWAFLAVASVHGFSSFLQYFSAVAILPLCLVWVSGARLDPIIEGSRRAVEEIPASGETPVEHRQSAAEINQAVLPEHAEKPSAPTPHTVVLIGENKDERLPVELASLLWLRGADNYVEVMTAEPDGVKVRLLRSSLASVQQQLGHTRVVRAHRSHMVNLDRVARWRGNSQGMKLFLRELDEPVAVSRAYVEPIKQALA